MDVQGKLVIITGSSQGLGKAFAVKLLAAGATVCLSDVNESQGEESRAELADKYGKNKVHFIKCNVLEKEDVENLYDGCEKHFNRSVDIFCNNAGINHVRGWKLCMDIDIMAVLECSEYVIDKMDTRKGGKGGLIVNTASLAGIANGWNRESACYFVAKHGVVALTRTLGTAKFMRETGVKVQCICPAFADTGILTDIGEREFAAVKKNFGLMTPEYVADGFMKLVTKCKTGDALVVVKDAPPFVYGDFSKQWTFFLAFGAKMFQSAFGVDLFEPKHQMAYIGIVAILLNFLLYLIFSILF